MAVRMITGSCKWPSGIGQPLLSVCKTYSSERIKTAIEMVLTVDKWQFGGN